MKDVIAGIFKFLAIGFDQIPFLNKFKDYRTVLGFLGMAVILTLKINGVIKSDELFNALQIGFGSFTALALNAKNNGN